MHYRARSYDPRVGRFTQKFAATGEAGNYSIKEGSPTQDKGPQIGPKEISVSSGAREVSFIKSLKLGWLKNEQASDAPPNFGFKVGFGFEVNIKTYEGSDETIVEQAIVGKSRSDVNGKKLVEFTPDERPADNRPALNDADWDGYDLFKRAKRGNDTLHRELLIENRKAFKTLNNAKTPWEYIDTSSFRISYVDQPGVFGQQRKARVGDSYYSGKLTGTWEQQLFVNIRAFHRSEKNTPYANRKTLLELSVYIHWRGEPGPNGDTVLIEGSSGLIGFPQSVKR